MKRSDINQAIDYAKTFFKQHQFLLPPFAFYQMNDWKNIHLTSAAEIIEHKLGWDITDYGKGDFSKTGLTLFTLRNGLPTKKHGKSYAEKIMISKEEQITPMHYHWVKIEDIINRGGGNLIIQLYWRNDETDELDEKRDIKVTVDGQLKSLKAGEHIRLLPGESVCLPPYLYHSFWGESGKGDVMVGEVSDVNDDVNDNRFLLPLSRFSTIQEDEAFIHLLCSDYDEYFAK